MDVSVRVKERFCKDCNIPIRLFQEPYFMDRLTLFDKFYGTLEKWNIFLDELQKYHCEQDYFEEYKPCGRGIEGALRWMLKAIGS